MGVELQRMSEGQGQLITVEEAAARLRVKPATVRLWLRTGRLRGVKVGPRLWRIPERSLREFLWGDADSWRNLGGGTR